MGDEGDRICASGKSAEPQGLGALRELLPRSPVRSDRFWMSLLLGSYCLGVIDSFCAVPML